MPASSTNAPCTNPIGAMPPRRAAPTFEGRGVHKREQPSVEQVDAEPHQLRPVAIRRKHRAEHVRQAHAGDAQTLSARHNACQHQGPDEAPLESSAPVHTGLTRDQPTDSARAPPRQPHPVRRVSRQPMSPTCVNACGKAQ
jgi:hypothetical protein